jgi:hypothetical protein
VPFLIQSVYHPTIPLKSHQLEQYIATTLLLSFRKLARSVL